jgi:hypothetical protein
MRASSASTLSRYEQPGDKCTGSNWEFWEFGFNVKYKSGKANVVADALNRRPDDLEALMGDRIKAFHVKLVEEKDFGNRLPASYCKRGSQGGPRRGFNRHK